MKFDKKKKNTLISKLCFSIILLERNERTNYIPTNTRLSKLKSVIVLGFGKKQK